MSVTIDGNEIRRLRQSMYYSQRELAKKANISNETVSRVETEGNISVHDSTVRKLSGALGVNPDDIVVGNNV